MKEIIYFNKDENRTIRNEKNNTIELQFSELKTKFASSEYQGSLCFRKS